MATLAMSSAAQGVAAPGAATHAAGKAQRELRNPLSSGLEAIGTRVSTLGAKALTALIENRKAQAMAMIERYDWRLAAELRAEQQGQAPRL